MDSTVKERIKSLMKERKLTTADLARSSGVSNSSLSEYFRGKYEIKQDKIFAIADALNVSPAWLLGFEDAPCPAFHETSAHYAAGRPQILLSDHERELIFKYRALDDTGRAALDAALDVMYKAVTPKAKKGGAVS